MAIGQILNSNGTLYQIWSSLNIMFGQTENHVDRSLCYLDLVQGHEDEGIGPRQLRPKRRSIE